MEIKSLFRSRPAWFVVICGFVLFITFLDSDSLMNRWKIQNRIRELEKQKAYYRQRIVEDSTLLENLKNDDFLEQYAREHFLMTREGETLFLVEE